MGALCAKVSTVADEAALELEALLAQGVIAKEDMDKLHKDFQDMDKDGNGVVSGLDAAAAGLPPAVWKNILSAACTDLSGKVETLCMAEFALLSCSRDKVEAARALAKVRAGSAFDIIARRPLALKPWETARLKPGAPLPKPRKRAVLKQLDLADVLDACALTPGLQHVTENIARDRVKVLGRTRKGRLTRPEFQALLLWEHLELGQVPDIALVTLQAVDKKGTGQRKAAA